MSAQCPNDIHSLFGVDRRRFLKTASAAAIAAGSTPVWAVAKDKSSKRTPPESLVKVLYESLSESQTQSICFPWNYQDPERGLLRTRVQNNWTIVEDVLVNDDFYSDDQRDQIRGIFEGIVHPDWHKRYYKQMEDDGDGFGNDQSVAIFGKPGEDKFEFVITGRHMTLRCDGNSADHVAFGGPIFYGHAAQGFDEPADHRGNVFWPQAKMANKAYQMLDGRQRKLALIEEGIPPEENVAFRGKKGQRPGIPVTEMSADQKEHLQKVLQKLVEPYRQSDQDEALMCLKKQGGLDACSLAFYAQNDIGDDGVWDVWRLEGPAFVWHFRGAPHVHVWVNVADNASVKLNADG